MRSIPPELLAKIKGQNQTIWNNANPKMSVVVARAKSSVRDSTYFTIEKIREKEGITDVAVSARRQKPIGPPDRIYGIHIDNGMAKTSIREYPDKLKQGWQYQFEVVAAKAVSIVFDARYHMNKYKKWGIKTDEVPWLFWIGMDDKLYCQLWDDVNTRYKMADDVVKLDSIRGWIPVQAGHTDDQGIIVAYIKNDGKVYYRNYCLQADGVTFVWELEREVTGFGTGNLGIRLFRANDFRVGFIAEKAAENLMAITVRNWAGMSIAPENLSARIKAEIDFIPLTFTDAKGGDEYLAAELSTTTYLCPINLLDIAPLGISRTSSTELNISFNVNLFNVSKNGFVVINDTETITYSINEVTFNSSTKKLKIELQDAIDAATTVKVYYTGSSENILVLDTNYCKLELNSFELTSEGAPQDGYEKEYLTANASAEIDLVALTFSSGFAQEYLTAVITTSIEFWHVDNAPI